MAPQPAPKPVIDLQRGIAALDEDIPRVLRVMEASSLEELGWSRPNKLSLLVPMSGTFEGATEEFLLRMGFEAYRNWPPSAQFVNPATGSYVYPQDQHFVPRLVSGECHTHAAYQAPGGSNFQLVCCSATLEFYDALHGVEPHHLWNESDTFYKTLTAIQKAFASSYQGRFPVHGS